MTKGKVVLLIAALAALSAATVGAYALFFKEEERVAVTGTTSYGFLNKAIEGSGTTTPADSISYDINGTVLEWYVEAGQDVEEGDLLYVLDSSDARDEILDNEVELDELYRDLADLQENIDNQRVTAEFSGRVESVTAEAGEKVQSGTTLAKLVDDTYMKATLYFSYVYQDDIREGMPVTASFPEQMLTLDGTVSEVRYVDYTTAEGLKCFAVDVLIENPGSLSTDTTVTCWMQSESGEEVYAVNDAKLEYNHVATVTAGASGELTAVNVRDYERVDAGQVLFVIDASSYETQMETLQKQIKNCEEKIEDLQESIDTEYTRYADISGRVVTASYSKNRMTGNDVGSVVIYNQESMEISVNIDELDADLLTVGMDVTVYRTTSSRTVTYPATLSYLSLEATSGQGGVSTFAATITIDSKGELSSGVAVYYSIDTGAEKSGGAAVETVLAPLGALCSYDDGYYLIVQSETRSENAIDPAEAGGSVTDFPSGYYAVPVEAGDFNDSYIQILSGVERDKTLFLRYRNTAPAGGDTTSLVSNDEDTEANGMPGYGNMPDFGGGMPDFGSGGMPSFGGSGGGMPSFGGGSGGGGSRSGGGMPGGTR